MWRSRMESWELLSLLLKQNVQQMTENQSAPSQVSNTNTSNNGVDR